MSQEQLGLDAGVARNFVSLIELGQNQPSLETLFRLAQALEQPASRLLAELETELAVATKSRRSAAVRK
jgi:transcriptional regulator with XRE-family HTH domain